MALHYNITTFDVCGFYSVLGAKSLSPSEANCLAPSEANPGYDLLMRFTLCDGMFRDKPYQSIRIDQSEAEL